MLETAAGNMLFIEDCFKCWYTKMRLFQNRKSTSPLNGAFFYIQFFGCMRLNWDWTGELELNWGIELGFLFFLPMFWNHSCFHLLVLFVWSQHAIPFFFLWQKMKQHWLIGAVRIISGAYNFHLQWKILDEAGLEECGWSFLYKLFANVWDIFL